LGGYVRTTQLRTYTVREGRLDEWVELWRTQVVPLRRSLGFEIHGSWVDRKRNAHVWVISYEGDLSFEEANAAYWASPQRKQLGVDPAKFLVAEDIRTVEEAM
jgi:hypothetical protein